MVHQRDTLRQYLKDRDAIPNISGRLVELRFEELERDPEGTLRRVYGALDLPGWETARVALRDYTRSLSGYRKNRYEIGPDIVELVQRECGFALESWAYEVPEAASAADSRGRH